MYFFSRFLYCLGLLQSSSSSVSGSRPSHRLGCYANWLLSSWFQQLGLFVVAFSTRCRITAWVCWCTTFFHFSSFSSSWCWSIELTTTTTTLSFYSSSSSFSSSLLVNKRGLRRPRISISHSIGGKIEADGEGHIHGSVETNIPQVPLLSFPVWHPLVCRA